MDSLAVNGVTLYKLATDRATRARAARQIMLLMERFWLQRVVGAVGVGVVGAVFVFVRGRC